MVTEERQYALMHAEEYIYDRNNTSRDFAKLEQNPLSDVRHVQRRAGVMLRGRWMPEPELRAMMEALVRSYARQ